MASKCCRIYNRASISYLKSAILKPNLKATTKSFSRTPTTPSPLRRVFVSRTPGELGRVASMLPLHSAVAMALCLFGIILTSTCLMKLMELEKHKVYG